MMKRIIIIIIVIAVAVCSELVYLKKQEEIKSKYDSALVAIENKEYEIAIDLLDELGNYKDSEILKTETLNSYYYSQARNKMVEGNYDQAIELFLNIKGYEDADKLRDECEDMKLYQTYSEAKVRDEIKFAGKPYIVLEKEETKLLLRSRSSIGSSAYEPSATISSWSTSELREYLNSSFLTENFSEIERKMICTTNLTTNGVETTDKVFIFSRDEARKYRMINKLDSHNWWLRDIASPAEKFSTAMYVNEYGKLVDDGMYTNIKAGLIIGMWIDYSKLQ